MPEEDAVREAEEVSGQGVSVVVGPAEGKPGFRGALDAGSCAHVDCDSSEIMRCHK